MYFQQARWDLTVENASMIAIIHSKGQVVGVPKSYSQKFIVEKAQTRISTAT